ncbi:hypothetical protein P43SY_011145 [Pythium insidiosum]|uniref:Uncharacterized protein n=1 Tax=Pythium insidiosum TaxID=114742 RepID=A0AAD5LES2_PYTIN|nr:hypothetical protein P43SY_011145 [Pythium insidiosum]
MVEEARDLIEERAALEEEADMLHNFRQILVSGFSAQKVSVTGALKTVHLQLVFLPEKHDCYLTWSPSRKREPRINLYDIEQIIQVKKEGNAMVAPRLIEKVSHRRGFIIVCKSHHRGRIILQVGSKRERKVLVTGFTRLLEELNRVVPNLDDAGALRKRLPRRQSVIQFFDPERTPVETAAPKQEDSSNGGSSEQDPVEPGNPANVPPPPSPKLSKRHSMISHFYKTRFDEPEPKTPTKPSFLRRSSVTT